MLGVAAILCDAEVCVKAKMDSESVLRMTGDQNCVKDYSTALSQCDENGGTALALDQDRQLVLSEHAVEMLKITEVFFKELP